MSPGSTILAFQCERFINNTCVTNLDELFHHEKALAAGSASVAQYDKHNNSAATRYDHKWKETDHVSAFSCNVPTC